MSIKAVIFDAYGTLVRNESLRCIPQRIVADHGLSARVEDVFGAWIARHFEATQRPSPLFAPRSYQTPTRSISPRGRSAFPWSSS
jgi:FMN phosphatase YigB (HAD superfamily)